MSSGNERGPASPEFVTKRTPYDFGHGAVEFQRVTPSESHEGGVRPLLFVQGHGQDPVLDRYLNLFAKTGKDAFGVAFTERRASKDSRLKDESGLSVKVSPFQLEKADDMDTVMEREQITECDIVATSEGALRAMIFAAKHPEKFRNIVLVHPAGMDDRGYVSTHRRVATYYGGRGLKRLLRGEEKQIEGGVEGFSNKGLRETRAEQKTVARSRLHTLIPELTEKYPHLLFSMIGDKNDGVFQSERLQAINKDALFEYIESDWGGHGIGFRQEGVNEIVVLLNRMEMARKV